MSWSVYPPEFRDAVEQLVELGLITNDRSNRAVSVLEITDTGFEVLERRKV